MVWPLRRKPVVLEPFDLTRALLALSPGDVWTIGDACEGTQVFGATGSGKTSGSGQAIATAMLVEGFGGLVLTAKPDERALWEHYCRITNRSESLVIFSADGVERFNFLDEERDRAGGSGLTENAVNLFMTIVEAAERGGSGGGPDPFWERALRQLLRNAIDLLVLAGQTLSLPDLAGVISSAPQHPRDASDKDWQKRSVCFRLLEAAAARRESGTLDAIEARDFDVTARYWLSEFPGLADRTRSSIVATFTTIADGFLRGQLAELFGTTTTIRPEDSHKGFVILIDLPVKRYHELGRLAQVLWKYVWQRATEARDVVEFPRPVFLWADEAQHFVTSHDMQFQATARSAKACTVYLTQNISNYYAVLGGEKGGAAKAATDSLLGNLQTKIFHANGDAETNEWAERVIAKRWRQRASTSSQERQRDPQNPLSGRSINVSTSPSLDSELLAGEFTRLRKGGPASGGLVDAYVFQGGRVWNASQTTFLKTTFRQ